MAEKKRNIKEMSNSEIDTPSKKGLPNASKKSKFYEQNRKLPQKYLDDPKFSSLCRSSKTPNKAFCKICDCELKGSITVLDKHLKTVKHDENMKAASTRSSEVTNFLQSSASSEHLPEWVQGVDDDSLRAYCRYCKCTLLSQKKDLRAHAKTKKHLRNVDRSLVGEEVKPINKSYVKLKQLKPCQKKLEPKSFHTKIIGLRENTSFFTIPVDCKNDELKPACKKIDWSEGTSIETIPLPSTDIPEYTEITSPSSPISLNGSTNGEQHHIYTEESVQFAAEKRESAPNLQWTKAVIGKPAPDWDATAVIDGQFKQMKLSNYRGKFVVFFFYPLDFTFVSPTEILAFNNRVRDFRALNTEVIGCSVDSPFAHLAWMKTPSTDGGIGQLNFPLVSDITHKIAKDYGVYCEDQGVALRGLFIIDDKGILRQTTVNDLHVVRSVEETLRLVQALQFSDKNGKVYPSGWKPGDRTIIVQIMPASDGSEKLISAR